MTAETLVVDDLLLLLFDDRSGTIAGEGTLFYTLGGAVLVELALLGHVDTDASDSGRPRLTGAQVRAVEGPLPSDPLLRTALEKVAEKPRGVQSLLVDIGADLRGQVVDRLVEQGHLRREDRRVLGLFPSSRLVTADGSRKAEVLEAVRAVLEDGAEPDVRTAALTALVSASGSLPSLHPAVRWSGAVYTRGKELEAGSWGADAVQAAVARTAMAVSVSSSVAIAAALGSRS